MDNPITLEEERKVWTIHQSVNGLTYYFNRATKKSQYEMPECFRTTEQSLDHPEWKEYRTAEGKKFYYNASSRKSSWQLPNEVKEFRIRLEEKRRKEKEQHGRLLEQEEVSEAELTKRKFLALLRGKSVTANTKWDSCIKLCQDDPRWQLLKISDKKKYYNQYISDLKKAEDTEKKARTEVHKNNFMQMLRESKHLNADSKMHKIALDFILDPRWRALDEPQRESTFQVFMDELFSKEKELLKEANTRNLEMLKCTFEQDCVKYNARWDDIRVAYKDNPYFKGLHPYDRISCFVDYILKAERNHEEASAKDKRLRQRSNRLNFRQLIKEQIQSGEISYKTKWHTFAQSCKQDKRLLNMMDLQQQGTTAQEIFQCVMEDIRENHKSIKAEIKQHFKVIGFKMTEQSPKNEFESKCSQLPIYSNQKELVKEYFYRYFIMKIKARNHSKQQSAKKAIKKERKIIFKIFKQLKDTLKTKYSIEDHMGKIQRDMKEYGISISHESIFKYYLAFLEGYETKRQASASNSSESHSKKEEIPKCLEAEEEGEIKEETKEEGKKKKNKSKKRRRSESSESD